MKVLEKGTFGKSKCAHDLVDILNSKTGKISTRLVSRILVDYFSGVKDIMKTEEITETLLKMWLEKFKDRIDNANMDIDIKNRVANLIVAKYRSELKKIKER